MGLIYQARIFLPSFLLKVPTAKTGTGIHIFLSLWHLSNNEYHPKQSIVLDNWKIGKSGNWSIDISVNRGIGRLFNLHIGKIGNWRISQ